MAINTKDYNFSFSGLKTAVLYKTKGERLKMKDKRYVQAMCREIQQAIIDVLIHKTLKAVKDYKAKTIILGGGVASNEELRKQLEGVNSKLERLIASVQALSHILTPAKMTTKKTAPAKAATKIVAKKASKKK